MVGFIDAGAGDDDGDGRQRQPRSHVESWCPFIAAEIISRLSCIVLVITAVDMSVMLLPLVMVASASRDHM